MRLTRNILALWLLAAGSCVQPDAQTVASEDTGHLADCAADFAVIEEAVRADYPGFPTVVPGREQEFDSLTTAVRNEVANPQSAADCAGAISRWLRFFGDNHLQAWDPTILDAEDGSGLPDTLALHVVDDSTTLLRIPSFGQRWKPAIDSLLLANYPRLTSRPYLVVDLRGNGGGWTASYEHLIPLLYTDPITREGMDAYASPGNIELMRQMAENSNTPEAIREQIRVLLPRVEAALGEFVEFAPDETFQLDSVFTNPRTVAVIATPGCASTCEAFVLDAMQSAKTTILGSGNTAGLLDYGNALRVELPSGIRRFQMPRMRSRRLPERRLDPTGIAPQVTIPEDVDPVDFAVRWLRDGASR